MDTLINLLSQIHLKDGILAVVVIYLLITDRADRKAEREFWGNFYKENKKEKDA
jgi:hypothetical protein